MKIAVPFEDGQVFQHFGRSAQFKFYEAENGQLLRTEVIPTNGQGHGALAGFLVQHGADVVLCGGIGTGAQVALMQAGIQLFGGLSGDADAAVADYLAGKLVFDPDIHCTHHDHDEGHSCGSHCGGGCPDRIKQSRLGGSLTAPEQYAPALSFPCLPDGEVQTPRLRSR